MAKKLKGAGWNKETMLVWVETKFFGNLLRLQDLKRWGVYRDEEFENNEVLSAYPAPTLMEIELPSYLCNQIVREQYVVDANLIIRNFDNKWVVNYMVPVMDHIGAKYVNFDFFERIEGSTEIEARAKMWLYLQEKGLI